MEPQVANNTDLDAFLEFLYDGLEGYIYLAAKDPHDDSVWKQEFCHWPTEAAKAKTIINGATNKFEIFIAPAIFHKPTDGQRSNVKATNVVWMDFDGNAPESWEEVHEPSLIVQSSETRNQHVYWRLAEPLDSIDKIEDINRRLAYNLQADSSGWDANQVLRPPNSINHKRQATTVLIHSNGTSYDLDIFDNLSPAPDQIKPDEWQLTVLPDIQDVILQYQFTPDMVTLFKKDKTDIKDRSASLMNLAYGCCQMGMKDAEVFVILRNADDRWEKFKNRKDRDKRLLHIITVARNKYPGEEQSNDNAFTIAMPYMTFLQAEIKVDWAIEPMLMDSGFMLMVGPPGIGKTQVALQFMIHLALGKDFLHYKIPEPKKICFLSLEMSHGELQVFLESMDKDLTDEERFLLEKNFIIVPHGEAWALNTPEGQLQLSGLLDQVQPYGLFIDSIGSSIIGNISSDETIQPLINYVDRLRKERGLFVWFIHHTRKHERGSSGNVTQDDIYGNMYLGARASSTYALLHGKGGTIKVRNFKNRLAKKEDDFLIERTENLNFNKTTKPVDDMVENNTSTPDKAPGGFDL